MECAYFGVPTVALYKTSWSTYQIGRRIVRYEPDGGITIICDNFEGKRFNSPNDLAIDQQGRIWFTDPRYGPRDTMEMRESDGALVEGVYRIDLDNKVSPSEFAAALRRLAGQLAPSGEITFADLVRPLNRNDEKGPPGPGFNLGTLTPRASGPPPGGHPNFGGER